MLAVADDEVGRDGRRTGDLEQRGGERLLVHELEALAAVAGLDHRGVVRADPETLGEPGAPVEVEEPHGDPRLRLTVECQQVRHLATDDALLARVEGGDAHVVVQAREHFAGVGGQGEAPLGGQVEPVGMQRRQRDHAGEDRDDGRDLHAEQQTRPAHATPRQARAPSARAARNRKSVVNAAR